MLINFVIRFETPSVSGGEKLSAPVTFSPISESVYYGIIIVRYAYTTRNILILLLYQ